MKLDWAFREHISRALPTELIFYLLRSIPSDVLIRAGDFPEELRFDTLEIIIKWLQVSFCECSRQTPQTENLICSLGTWFGATERLIQSLPG